MLSRHTNELYLRLETVVDLGAVTIRKQELLKWYGQQRVTVNIWRDIQEKWDELAAEIPLLVGEADGAWTFAWGEGLKTSEDSWFKEIGDRAKKRSDATSADGE